MQPVAVFDVDVAKQGKNAPRRTVEHETESVIRVDESAVANSFVDGICDDVD